MSSGFVSEKTIEEKRKQRQEEWEKVRKPEDPEKAPEEPVETRSLYEQLQAHKAAADEEYQEKTALKNQIRGIDDDEAEFLDQVDDYKSRIEVNRRREEKAALEDFRKTQEKMREEQLEAKLKADAPAPVAPLPATKKSKQTKLLLGAVKTNSKRPSSTNESKETEKAKKAKPEEDGEDAKPVLGALAGLGDYSSSEEDDS